MKFLSYEGLQEYDALIKQYIQNNIPESSEIAEALQNAYNPNSTIRIAICTQAEYNALQNPEQNVLYIISDETSEVVNVEANPTLDGTESVLGSIKIGGVKYAMPSGGGGSSVEFYEHCITLQFGYTSGYGGAIGNVTLKILTTTNDILTRNNIMEIMIARGFTSSGNCYSASGFITKQSSGIDSATPTNKFIIVSGIYSLYNSTYSFAFTGSKLELTSNNVFNITMFDTFEISNSNISGYTDTITKIL